MLLNRKPVHLIQVFCNAYEYVKAYKNYGERKSITKWKKKIPSDSAIHENEGLVRLNQACYENGSGILGDTLMLIDYNWHSFDDYLARYKLLGRSTEEAARIKEAHLEVLKTREKCWTANLTQRSARWSIFTLEITDNINLFLEWDKWKVGYPEMANYKIAELKRGQPVEILLDGKRDFSLTGRRKRIFIENNYLFEYKGLFNKVELVEDQHLTDKEIPTELKRVNLLRYLK